jgi:PAS domain S-box-containing protein
LDALSPARLTASPLAQRRLHALARSFMAATAACCTTGALVILWLSGSVSRGLVSAVAFMVVAAGALAVRSLPPVRMTAAMTAVQMSVALVIAGNGVSFGWGLAVPGLQMFGLTVCVLGAAGGWRAGAMLSAFCAVLVVLLAWLVPEAPGISDAVASPTHSSLLVVNLVCIAAGMAAGWLISRLLTLGMLAAQEREQRFSRLLALSVDGYWEIDDKYRLKAAADRTGEVVPLRPGRGLDAVPWEMPQWQCDADTQDVMLADLEGRQPFRDLTVRWGRTDGSFLTLLVSGEPRFDKRGVFTGYWGVLRDITIEQRAQAALEATQTRYHELFARIPSPLVLHRNGRVLDANVAALALFGQPDRAAMAAADLLSFYEAGESRELARSHMDLLHAQRLGAALPPGEFTLSVAGRRVAVRAASVRVDAEGGPATLCIFVDETERLAAENAVRRSEAMLSTLVASSPDLITLTEIDSGRYAMVNRSFERITGWTAAEAIGRTANELGIWGTPAARDVFVQRMRRDGSVTDSPQTFVDRHGAKYPMVVSAACFNRDGRDYMVINARDVSDRERARLEREAILQSASIGIAVTRRRHFVMVNRHFEQMFGWDAGELDGQSTRVAWNDLGERIELGKTAGAALLRGESVDIEREGKRKDGSSFTARVRGRSVDPDLPVEGGLVWIVEDVTQRREFERQLARARDEAQAASRAKSAFLANTSHELRTPLNGLIGLSRLARDESLKPERRRLYLEQIELSAQSLAGIISDILDLSRIEAGKMPIERAEFDLVAELTALHRTYAVLAELRGLRMHVEIAGELMQPVLGDALRLRQILSNFVVNALKFTEKGTVTLRAARLRGAQGDVVRFEVQDTGRGVAAQTLGKLFEPFTQADASTTRRFGGTGLGLSICRELAMLMAGQVGASSEEGKGSLFWAELPLPVTTFVPLSRAEPEPAVEPPGADSPRQLPGARVLMVEDNAVNMMIAVALLERWGVTVTQAADGREAVAAVQAAAASGKPFHAVLMDVQMPVMSGHEATRMLRAREAAQGAKALPIIALTAAALVSERDEALRAGMNDFLTKPVDAEKLFSTLRRWCASSA